MPNETNHVLDGLTVVGSLALSTLGDGDKAFLEADLTGGLLINGSPVFSSTYAITIVDGTGRLTGPSGTLISTNPDSAALVQLAITAIGTNPGRIELRPGTHTWSTVPTLPHSRSNWLEIVGVGRPKIALTSGAPRVLDPSVVATTLNGGVSLPQATITVASTTGFASSGYLNVGSQLVAYTGVTSTTFTGCSLGSGSVSTGSAVSQAHVSYGKVIMRGFDVDATAVTGKHHVLFGTYRSDAFAARRLSYQDWLIEDVNMTGGVVDTAASLTNDVVAIGFRSLHEAAGESVQNVIRRITIRDVQIDGYQKGIQFGAFTSATTAANILIDDILVERCAHRIASPHTGAAIYQSANFQFGQWGKVGRVTLRDCYGANSGDVGVEINCAQDALIDRCEFADGYSAPIFVNNYQALQNADTSVVKVRDTTITQSTASMPATRGIGAVLGNSNPHGHLDFQYRYDRTATDFNQTSQGLAFNCTSSSTQVRRLDLDVVAEASGWTYTGTSSNPSACFINTGNISSGVLRVKLRFKWDGTRSGASVTSLGLAGIRMSGTFSPELVEFDGEWNMTNAGGAGAQTNQFIGIDIGSATSTLSGTIRIENSRVRAITGETGSRGVIVRGVGTLTLNGLVVVENNDFSVVTNTSTSTSGAVLMATTPAQGAPENGDKTIVRQNRLNTALVPKTITPGASPYVHQQIDPGYNRVVISGGTVSQIRVSPDGTNWSVTGETAGVFDLPTGHRVEVTYTVAPGVFQIHPEV